MGALEIFNAVAAIIVTASATLYLHRERRDDPIRRDQSELFEDFIRRTDHLVDGTVHEGLFSRSEENASRRDADQNVAHTAVCR
ncbi:hypothetical protein J7376_16085 [Paracoccus sp. R12_1]|nr:hypothetical protein [Paracoccus sp. R12_1]